MLTKEECLEALTEIKMYGSINIPLYSLEVIENLIDEHFDNPPLGFEELQEDMWVWDNKEKMYIHSVNNYDSEVYGKGIRVKLGFDLVRYPFEQNRFYRKEVQE